MSGRKVICELWDRHPQPHTTRRNEITYDVHAVRMVFDTYDAMRDYAAAHDKLVYWWWWHRPYDDV